MRLFESLQPPFLQTQALSIRKWAQTRESLPVERSMQAEKPAREHVDWDRRPSPGQEIGAITGEH